MQERTRLGALTAFVLIAHLWLLQSRDGDIYLANAVTTSAFSTRHIDMAPPPPPSKVLPNLRSLSANRPRLPSQRKTDMASQNISASSPAVNSVQPAEAVPGSGTEVPLSTIPTASVESRSSVTATVEPTPAPSNGDLHPAAARPQLSLRLPGSRRLKYAATGEARKLRYSADAELHWLHDGASYAARLEVGAFLLGKRIQTSAGELGSSGLEPKRFSDKTRSEVAAHFERAKGVVVFSANTPDAPLLPGAQDRLSVLLQLSTLLGGAPERYPAGTRFAIQTVGPREAESWQFVVEDDEILTLKDGATPTRKLQRLPVREFDLKVEVWLAPSIDWLPVQVKLTQANGDFVQLALESAEKP